MTALDAALAALRRRPTLSLLESLVCINSHSANVVGVNAVGELLIEALRDLPLQLELEAAPSGAHHLSFRTEAAGAPVLLIGHHDTVFPPGTFEGFRIDGDIARGPGVLDMKGGLTIIVDVLHALHAARLLERLPLRFVCVADEEIGSPSGGPLLARLAAGAQAALVFEAGRQGDAVITARRGSGSAIVRAAGRAAHAGNALAEGRNAIWALSRFVDTVSREQAVIFEGASANVGLFQGGSARNTVPAAASCELDLRFSDQPGKEALLALLERAAREAEAGVPGTQLEVDARIAREPWARSAASSALAARYGRCAEAAGLLFSEAPRIGGGSDANTVAALGLPVIDGLGPRGRGFHTHDEQIEVSSLSKKAEALLRFSIAEAAR